MDSPYFYVVLFLVFALCSRLLKGSGRPVIQFLVTGIASRPSLRSVQNILIAVGEWADPDLPFARYMTGGAVIGGGVAAALAVLAAFSGAFSAGSYVAVIVFAIVGGAVGALFGVFPQVKASKVGVVWHIIGLALVAGGLAVAVVCAGLVARAAFSFGPDGYAR